jgi:hypothetical protein
MLKTNLTPHDSSFVKAGKLKSKDNYHEVQTRKFKKYLIENTATCTMVSNATGIPQKNLTRYKRHLEDEGKLIELFQARCKDTGFPASYLTCNLELIERAKQDD